MPQAKEMLPLSSKPGGHDGGRKTEVADEQLPPMVGQIFTKEGQVGRLSYILPLSSYISWQL